MQLGNLRQFKSLRILALMVVLVICFNKLRKHGNLVSLCIARGWGDCNHIVFQALKSRDASRVADGVSLRCATLLERHQQQSLTIADRWSQMLPSSQPSAQPNHTSDTTAMKGLRQWLHARIVDDRVTFRLIVVS